MQFLDNRVKFFKPKLKFKKNILVFSRVVAVDYSVQNWKYGIEYLYSHNFGEN